MIDIDDIQAYTNYTVDLELTAESLMEHIYTKAKTYMPSDHTDQIREAFEFARSAHE
jgi:hypothetical protein